MYLAAKTTLHRNSKYSECLREEDPDVMFRYGLL